MPWLLNVSSLCPLCRLDLAKDREPSGAEAEPADGAEVTAERPPARPRASSVLASSFRQLLPTAAGGNRASRQAQPAAAEGVNTEAGVTGELGQNQLEEGQQNGQQGATRSRWMRYVEQRRQRVRARTLTRRDQPPAPPPAER